LGRKKLTPGYNFALAWSVAEDARLFGLRLRTRAYESAQVHASRRSTLKILALARMSAMGHLRTSASRSEMSALPPKADMFSVKIDVCIVPLADMGWEKRRASPPSGGLSTRQGFKRCLGHAVESHSAVDSRCHAFRSSGDNHSDLRLLGRSPTLKATRVPRTSSLRRAGCGPCSPPSTGRASAARDPASARTRRCACRNRGR
jgi:hypothetical protein